MSQSVMVIGLGRMGFALARQLLAGGFNVFVWNRTAHKAAPLVEAGASQAADVASGIAASEVIVICVGTYDDSYEVLADCGDLSGKILLQLTSASAEDALGMAQWAAERGARYLDGFIAAFPQDIGTPECPLHIAGEADAWETVEDAVMCLGGASGYIGENVAAGAVLDQANILFGLTSSLAVIHGARMAESVGLDVGNYADAMVNAVAHQLAPNIAITPGVSAPETSTKRQRRSAPGKPPWRTWSTIRTAARRPSPSWKAFWRSSGMPSKRATATGIYPRS